MRIVDGISSVGQMAEICPGEAGIGFRGGDSVAVCYWKFEAAAVEFEVFFGCWTPFVGAGPVFGVVERCLGEETGV